MRAPKRTGKNPDERSEANSRSPLVVLGLVIAGIVGVVVALQLVLK